MTMTTINTKLCGPKFGRTPTIEDEEEWGPVDYELSNQLCKEMLSLPPIGYMPPVVNGERVYKYPPIRCHGCRSLLKDGHNYGCRLPRF
jgi:hypothetical protein